MTSMPCHHCGKVKRCALHRDTERGGAILYLCAACLRELNRTDEAGNSMIDRRAYCLPREGTTS